MKRIIFSCIIGMSAAFSALAGPSILDIKHSITDDNIITPEAFETATRQIEENFYLNTFTADRKENGPVKLGTPEEYEERLSRLPTVIEMPYNDVVKKWIELYLEKRRGLVSNLLALHNYYGPIFVEELSKEDMPLELQYLPVIESAINPNAESRAKATGLWQFMYGTAKGLGMEMNSLVDQRRDPRESSRQAARYLKQLYNAYGDWSLAIAAYNCGPGNVNKAIKRAGGGKKDFWEIYRFLPEETKGYLPAFIAANYVMTYYNLHDIAPRVVKQQLVTDTVMVNNRVHFNQISGVLNIPVDEIRMLNPQFVKDIIPGNNHPYPLVLPSQQCLSYIMSEPQILEFEKEKYAQRTYVEPGETTTEPLPEQPNTQQSENASENVEVAMVVTSAPTRITHVVHKGENIGTIARKYGVSASDIKRWNSLPRGKVKEGDNLIIEVYDNGAIQNQFAQTNTVPPAPVNKPAEKTEVPRPNKVEPEPKPEVPAPANKVNDNAASVPTRNNDVAESNNVENTGSSQYLAEGQTDSSTSQAASETPSQRSRRNNATENGNQGNNKNKNKNKNNKQNKKPEKPKTITVKQGDSLEKLARANGTTVDEIRKANNMKKDQSLIREGQELKIPKSSGKNNSKNGGKGKKKR